MNDFKIGDRVRVIDPDFGAEVGRAGSVVEAGHNPGPYVPVQLDGDIAEGLYLPSEIEHVRPKGRRLTVKQGESTTTFEGDFDFEVEDLDAFVQVRTSGYPRLTYRDPSGTLAKGDHVLVPLGYANKEQAGKVVALGRGRYTGPAKDVIARLNREELSAA